MKKSIFFLSFFLLLCFNFKAQEGFEKLTNSLGSVRSWTHWEDDDKDTLIDVKITRREVVKILEQKFKISESSSALSSCYKKTTYVFINNFLLTCTIEFAEDCLVDFQKLYSKEWILNDKNHFWYDKKTEITIFHNEEDKLLTIGFPY